jgi:4-carboxymuconolactone decarboxylase
VSLESTNHTPRIAPLPAEGTDPSTRELLAAVGRQAGVGHQVVLASNLFRTLMHHPRIFKRWLGYGSVLLDGALPGRDRELLVLRAAHRSDCAYEWAHHEAIAARNGLSDEEIARVRGGARQPGWSAFDASLLQAVDELLDDHRISDSTWQVLAERYDERQLIEVPFIVGVYAAMGFTLNSLGVQLESDGLSATHSDGGHP